MTSLVQQKKVRSIRGVTLVEMALVCVLFAFLTIGGIRAMMNYIRNQDIANNTKLDRQSLQELMRATNNYFAVCQHSTSVTIDYLQNHEFLGMSPIFNTIEVSGITASSTDHIYTISANYTGESAYQNRYAALLAADQVKGSTFYWKRAVGVYESYSSTDVNLGAKMGRYIQSMSGAKQCQS